jgi:hypothetical protein
MGVCGLAAWRGRDYERLAAAGYLANWALSMMVFRDRSTETQWNVLYIDMALLALYVALALRSGRYWPMFAASFQLLAVVTHIARALDATVTGWAYLTAEIVWSYLVLATIGYASWTAGQPREDDEAA